MDAVQYAKLHKIKISRDLKFASYANLPITSYTSHPPLMALEQYPYKQGEQAMNLMMTILQNKLDGKRADHFFSEKITPTLIET
jgi:DNA-binding LacI/PurR family transcriptional regulator